MYEGEQSEEFTERQTYITRLSHQSGGINFELSTKPNCVPPRLPPDMLRSSRVSCFFFTTSKNPPPVFFFYSETHRTVPYCFFAPLLPFFPSFRPLNLSLTSFFFCSLFINLGGWNTLSYPFLTLILPFCWLSLLFLSLMFFAFNRLNRKRGQLDRRCLSLLVSYHECVCVCVCETGDFA